MVPLSQVELDDVNHDLEGHDHKIKEEIVNEISDLDTIVFSYHCLLVENPQLEHKKW